MGTVSAVGTERIVPAAPDGRSDRSAGDAFGSALREACARRNIRLSGHAAERLEERRIPFGSGEIDRIALAMDRIAEKGGSKSAIVCDGTIFIADARDRAVITALPGGASGERVLTGIDSAIIV